MIPITLYTGYFEAGKTTRINHSLKSYSCSEGWRLLLLSFEDGFQTYQVPDHLKKNVHIEIYENEDILHHNYFENCAYLYDEIWIEYNGTTSLDQILKIKMPKDIIIKDIICVCDAVTFQEYVTNIDDIVEQMVNCSQLIITKAKNSKQLKRVKRYLKILQPKATVYYSYQGSYKEWNTRTDRLKKISSMLMYLLGAVCLLSIPIWNENGLISEDNIQFFRMFFSIILQAVPFLIIGITLSAIFQRVISVQRFIGFITRHQILAFPFLLMGGCVFPLCDCAMVPVTEKLIQKGLSLPLSMMFFCMSSCMNPIVLLSTYYAFPEDSRILPVRFLLSISIALFTGLMFFIYEKKTKTIFSSNREVLMKADEYEWKRNAKKHRITVFGLQISDEFYRIMLYVIIGAFLATCMQLLNQKGLFPFMGSASLGIFFMFLASLFLSICVSGNAFIAKSFANTLPVTTVIPFMVFGPLLDIKNLMMLSSRFHKQFMRFYLLINVLGYFIISIIFMIVRRSL